jgi:hypothetical protein
MYSKIYVIASYWIVNKARNISISSEKNCINVYFIYLINDR